jgi:hypothetical protein
MRRNYTTKTYRVPPYYTLVLLHPFISLSFLCSREMTGRQKRSEYVVRVRTPQKTTDTQKVISTYTTSPLTNFAKHQNFRIEESDS